MSFKVAFSEKALKQLKKIQGCFDPRQHGKALISNRSGQWRYRVGDYRIIAQIKDEEVIVLVIEVVHRREIYDK